MKHKHSMLRRALSIVLSFAIILPTTLALVGDSGSAHAVSTKTKIRVLAIEPSGSEELTTDNVKRWTGYWPENISITFVSSLEYVGMTDDLVENYDLIYIGHNGGICDFPGYIGYPYSSSAVTNLDSDYLYANIGKEVSIPNRSSSSAVGLTDSEYLTSVFSSSYHKINSAAQKTRYPGNDISPAKLAELNRYVSEGHPVIISSGLTTEGGHAATSAVTFTANLSSGTPGFNRINLTASAVATTGTLPTSTPIYQWYKDGVILSGKIYSGYSATEGGKYNCRITYTIDGKPYSAYSKSVVVTAAPPRIDNSSAANGSSELYYYSYFTGAWWHSGTDIDSVSVAVSDSNGTLTASPNYVSGPGSNTEYTYQWYNANGSIDGASGSTYTPTTNGSYYCKASTTEAYYYMYYTLNGTPARLAYVTPATSQTVILTKTTITNDPTQTGSPATIPQLPATAFSIDSTKVDNCSNMYTLLNGINGKANVMSTLIMNYTALRTAINLSAPTITLSSQPPAYAISVNGSTGTMTSLTADAGSNPATYTLKYTFTIGNEPSSIDSYFCNLYIDSDGNGNFSTTESINSGVVIRKTNATGAIVNSGNLKSDNTKYYLSYTLPASIVGIIPWKLEVVKNDDARVHASVIDYAHVAGTARAINILQIYASTGLPLDTTGAAFTSSPSRTNFKKLFGQVSSDYTIKIQTVNTGSVNTISSTSIINKLDGKNTAYTDITSFINSFDMILLGVGGSNYDLTETTSKAIAEYLKSRPVLFTHDTTSLANVPPEYDSSTSSNYKGAYPYGYNINNILRDPFGLDLYGVTNDTYGHTAMSNLGFSNSGIVASNDYPNMSETQTSDLLNAGYSVAYQPGSNTTGLGGTPVVTTQGFATNAFTTSYATKVWQVNEGQITSFPFDINSGIFERENGASATMSSTHSQYYQVNMNSKDTTVWYCLSQRDVANAAYIYSHGNATFSGFGHTISDISDSSSEAQLFINTIIAAFRSTTTKPDVKFSDITGNKVVANFLMPTDDYGVLTITNSKSTDRNLYFTVTDTNSGMKKITAAFSYIDLNVNHQITVPIYYMSGTTEKTLGYDSLISGQLYYVKIDAVWNKILQLDSTAEQNLGAGIPINVIVTTKIGGSDIPPATATLTLRKFMLFDLG